MALSVEQQSSFAELEQLLASMTPRDRVRVLLDAGVPAIAVMGLAHCVEHQHTGCRTMSDVEPLSFDSTSMWCQQCFRWWKI